MKELKTRVRAVMCTQASVFKVLLFLNHLQYLPWFPVLALGLSVPGEAGYGSWAILGLSKIRDMLHRLAECVLILGVLPIFPFRDFSMASFPHKHPTNTHDRTTPRILVRREISHVSHAVSLVCRNWDRRRWNDGPSGQGMVAWSRREMRFKWWRNIERNAFARSQLKTTCFRNVVRV
ncbi:uncharacterized protein F4822DRAFT_335762 [Hypoxylon trugodes]|uniref:uncharacterized protein n=1 Tax=Hypoxylon trugodes TaxID=326681 RepID=UPI00218CBCF3|nr:uncharacterized protein F4822DRAFT_335762 [Hypoxylon trugodes]KAI1385169.1 hypothetical protein F4822DRAFT_335762 [Hypoxylon trugodes]